LNLPNPGGGRSRRGLGAGGSPSTAEELVENAAAIGPEYQHHTHERASGHHTRSHRQGELFGELWFQSLEQERNEGAQEEQKPIIPRGTPRRDRTPTLREDAPGIREINRARA